MVSLTPSRAGTLNQSTTTVFIIISKLFIKRPSIPPNTQSDNLRQYSNIFLEAMRRTTKKRRTGQPVIGLRIEPGASKIRYYYPTEFFSIYDLYLHY